MILRNYWSKNHFEDCEALQQGNLAGWFLLLGALGVWLIVCASIYVWLQVQRVNLGYRLAELQTEQQQLRSVQRKLQLELHHLQEPFNLEKFGKERFGMAPPKDNQRLVIR